MIKKISKEKLHEYMEDKLYRHSYCLLNKVDIENAKEFISNHDYFSKYDVKIENENANFERIELVGKEIYSN